MKRNVPPSTCERLATRSSKASALPASPPTAGTPWEWCEEHVHVDETWSLPGRWHSDASPWVRGVMEDFGNNGVRDIAVQSAKAQTVMNCACWAIAEDPGPIMWVAATKDQLRDILRDRLTGSAQRAAA
ncbi:MAG: phage terminase large subunit family protein [Candidatus Omnitrophica bacterium]|nr:phage terminase large subunit family protein [Candidatus Omnitrophota bacterium]